MKVSKKEVASALLHTGSVFLHLDPRKLGVVLPSNLRLKANCVLQIGWDIPLPIPDLLLDEEGVYGTLSFSQVPFTCFIPWRAIYAIVGEDAKGLTWNEDMPQEVVEEIQRDKVKHAGNVVDIRSKIKKESSAKVSDIKSNKAKVKPRHLKLVK